MKRNSFKRAMSIMGITQKTTDVFFTSDGVEFRSAEAAEKHEIYIVYNALGKRYKLYSNHLYNNVDIVKYILHNRKSIERLFVDIDNIQEASDRKARLVD